MNLTLKNFNKSIDKKYLADIKRVADEGLSCGFLTDTELENFGNDDCFCSFVVDENDNVQGVSYGRFLNISQAAELLKCNEKDVSEIFPNVTVFADHTGIAVSPNVRGNGVSNVLFSVYNDAILNKASVVFYNVWVRNGGEKPAVSLIEGYGASFLKRIPQYWYDVPDLYCDVCKGRCKCDCDIYFITKDGFK